MVHNLDPANVDPDIRGLHASVGSTTAPVDGPGKTALAAADACRLLLTCQLEGRVVLRWPSGFGAAIGCCSVMRPHGLPASPAVARRLNAKEGPGGYWLRGAVTWPSTPAPRGGDPVTQGAWAR
ncbi:MAG: hypothetical protein IPM99_22790 [Rubrivivax sp.]|nr:hypothetical protein [Rubrivivax sp.]